MEMKLSSNIATGKLALQSSYSQYSQKDDPLGAITGKKSGGFGFHTKEEDGPWWMLDLGSFHRIKEIRIFNRCDAARHRIRNCKVEAYSLHEDCWKPLYVALNEFGGELDQRPLILDFHSDPVLARFIKISLSTFGILHLDEVEVYGEDVVQTYAERLRLCGTKGISKVPPSSQRLGAIVALTRGYDDKTSYAALIARNAAIFHHINQGKENQYPLIIWHEGNISLEQQSYIRSFELNDKLEFVDISSCFRLPPGIDPERIDTSWNIGYKLMCKFNTFDIWQLSRAFRYILRIDEDCVIRKLDCDPFEWADTSDIDVGFSFLSGENHEQTNNTLPLFAAAYAQSINKTLSIEALYNHLFPYSNCMISKTEFFLREDVQDFLLRATQEQDFYGCRWGDLPVNGIALNLFSDADHVRMIPGLTYRHDSHLIEVDSRDDRLPHENRHPYKVVLETACSIEQQEERLLASLSSQPNDTVSKLELVEVMKSLGRHRLVGRVNLPNPTSAAIAQLQETAQSLVLMGHYVQAVRCFSDLFEQYHEVFESDARYFVENFPEAGGASWVSGESRDRPVGEIFKEIYDKNIWGGGSGGGSFIERVAMYAGLVQYVIRRYNVKSICDVGCGDWQFSRYLDLSGVTYRGFDIVASVVENNRRQFGSPTIEFIHADASTLSIPECDLVICKDVLQHLSNTTALKVLQQRAGGLWLLTNDYAKRNAESRDGDTRPLDPVSPPFSLSGRPIFAFDGKISFLAE